MPIELGLGLRGRFARFFPGRNDIDDAHLKLLIAFTVGGTRGGMVDVGAHRGLFLRHAVRVAPDRKHIAIEPIPELAKDLRDGFPGVDVHEVALSDGPGRLEFNHIVDNPAYSGLKLRPDLELDEPSVIEVEVTTLDDLIPQEMKPALLKIDVEGGELQVLRGASRLLREDHPIIAFEWGEAGARPYGADSAAMWDLLDGHGYRVFNLDGVGPYSRVDFEANDTYWNWVAH